MSWYYAHEGKPIGPVDDADFAARVAAGSIRPDTQVWREGMAAWQPYASAAGQGQGAAGGAASPPVVDQRNCSQCGRPFTAQEMIRYDDLWVCAACKPAFVQALKEGTPVSRPMTYGGFWIRLAAYVLDSVILWMVSVLLQTPVLFRIAGSAGKPPSPRLIGMQMLLYLVQIVIICLYKTFFVGKFGATPGKMACGLKIVTAEDRPLTYAGALGRYFATWISTLTFGIGYLMVAFDDQKRSLHDRICETRVVKR